MGKTITAGNDSVQKIKINNAPVKRTFKYCQECKKVTEVENGYCTECPIPEEPVEEKRTLYFKVRHWRRRCNQSAYNRDKMKDLMSP